MYSTEKKKKILANTLPKYSYSLSQRTVHMVGFLKYEKFYYYLEKIKHYKGNGQVN